MRCIPDASADCLMAFIEDSIKPSSAIRTDGWLGNLPVEGKGYKHETVYLQESDKPASELIARMHSIVALPKRWLLGAHKGGVSMEHLDAYLDVTFRFNRRNSRSRSKLFCRLLEQVIAIEPVPYKSLVKCAVDPDF